MLKDSLYKIIFAEHQDGIIKATLELDKEHAIFSGHFPKRPVLPGACMLQMVKEVLELELNTSLRLTKATQVKFLQLTDPRVNNLVELTINYEHSVNNIMNVSAVLAAKAVTCFKFRGNFITT